MKYEGADKNLKPFLKGNDPRRNVTGNNRKLDLDTLLVEHNNDIPEVVKKLVQKAKAGDLKAMEIVLDRYFGKAKQSIDLSGDIGLTINLVDGTGT